MSDMPPVPVPSAPPASRLQAYARAWRRLRVPTLVAVLLTLLALYVHLARLIPSRTEFTPEARRLAAVRDALLPLAEPLGRPQPGEWLYTQRELGQTFEQYLRGEPTLATGARRKIYVLPLGDFAPEEFAAVEKTTEFMRAYFGLECVLLERQPAPQLPASAVRRNPLEGQLQWHAPTILARVLAPALPDDAMALIAFTMTDLYPDPKWNFVFGQASLVDRVGVWSLARFGDPRESDAAAKLYLLRALKIAAHETGHMFGINHCTRWRCCMNGSMTQEESDAKPLALCGECLPKILWATGADALPRYRALEEFCRAEGFIDEAESFARLGELLGDN